MNADNRSLSLNEETVLMMLDDEMARTLDKHFIDDLEFSDEIKLDTFRQRPFMDRVKEKIFYAFWRVL